MNHYIRSIWLIVVDWPRRGGGEGVLSSLHVAVNGVSLAPGGGMVVLVRFLRAFRHVAPDLQFTVYASRRPVLEQAAEAHPDARVVPFFAGRSPALHYIGQNYCLGPLIQRAGADVVWTTNHLIGRCRVPQVVHHQNLLRFPRQGAMRVLVAKGPADALRDAVARTALRRSAANVFVSEYLRCRAEEIVPESSPRNHVVRNAIPVIATGPSLGREDNLLVAVQSPHAYKGTGTVVRVLKRLVELRPEVPWQLVICGGLDPEIARLVEQLGVQNAVSMLGHIDCSAIEALFDRALCLISPSCIEAASYPPLEAMARGCVPVVCDATAMPEIVGAAGFLVPPGDIEAFASAVLELRDDADKRRSLEAAGRQRATLFDIEVWAATLANILRETASGLPVAVSA